MNWLDIQRYPKLPYIIIAALAIIIYSNTVTFDYALDDAIVITQNDFTKKGFSGIWDILTNDSFTGFFKQKKNLVEGGRYRPLSVISFAIEYQIFGEKPAVSHSINVLLYAFTGILIYLLLLKLIPPADETPWYLSVAFITSVLYVAHPIHTEAVANIKGRDELLTFIFSLGSILLLLKYLRTEQVLLLVLAFFSFFFGLLSKENAITFLAVIPLAFWVFTDYKPVKILITLIPVILAAGIFLVIRQKVLGELADIGDSQSRDLMNNPFLQASEKERLATIFYTLWYYIRLLFVPTPLTYDYYPKHFPILNWSSLKAVIPFIIYLGLGIYAVWGCIKKQIPAFAIAFYIITISIVSNIVFPVGTFMNERFIYISSLGFALMLGWGFNWLFINKNILDNAAFGLIAAIVLIYGWMTFERNFAWKNDFTLFLTDIDSSPNSAKGNLDAGGQLWENAMNIQDNATAKELMQNKLLRFYIKKSGLNESQVNGKFLKQLMLEKSRDYLSNCVKIYPGFNTCWQHLGNAYQLLEQYEASYQCYKNAYNINPTHAETRSNLQALAHNSFVNKKYDIALESYNLLLAIQPKSVRALMDIANVYEAMKNVQKAAEYLQKAIQLEPENNEVYNQLGQLYGKTAGDMTKAIFYLQKSVELDPDYVSSLINLAIAYSLSRQFDLARKTYETAITKNPTKAQLQQIYQNMAAMFDQMGDKTNAAKYASMAQSTN